MNTEETAAGLSLKLRKLSKNQLSKRDVLGRSILHLLCILGENEMLREMLEANSNIDITMVDYENGWTALHTALFYGKLSCARILIDRNYELMKIKDRSGLTPADFIQLDYTFKKLKKFPVGISDENYIEFEERFINDGENVDELEWWDANKRGGSSLLTFGANVNNQLGTGDSDDHLKIPYKVEIESLNSELLFHSRIKDFKISKYHSIVLTNDPKNNLLICGNPSRGRLGSNSSIPYYKFKHLPFFHNQEIIQVAISNNHSMALSSSGEVFSWGLNNYHQLGYQTEISNKISSKTESYSNEPRKITSVLKKYKIEGISCSKIHSAAYSGSTLILWGLNVGQMDYSSTGEITRYESYKGIIQHQRVIEFHHKIKQVLTTVDSTTVLLENSDCHILSNNSHLKLQLPLFKSTNQFDIFKPTVFSKRLKIVKLVSRNLNKFGILYNDGSISCFNPKNQQQSNINIKYTNIWNPNFNHLKCVDFDLGADGSIILVTQCGAVYISHKPEVFDKIKRLNKIVKVSCDEDFLSFGFIKDDIDQLPMILNKNSFFNDILYLSPVIKSDKRRKQSQLYDSLRSDKINLNFLYKPEQVQINDEFDTYLGIERDMLEDELISTNDELFNKYINRWNISQSVDSTFQKIDHNIIKTFLKSPNLKELLLSNDYSSDKSYDLYFKIDDVKIGVHKAVLFAIPKLLKLENGPLVFDNNIKFNKIENSISIVENCELQSLLIFVLALYTGQYFKIWQDFKFNDQFYSKVKSETKSIFSKLELLDDFSKVIHEFSFNNKDIFTKDVHIQLADDQELFCCSYILKSRSAYFETVFNEFWEDDEIKILDFTHVDIKIFQIILDYVYGVEQLELFDSFDDINEVDFINFQFELIEICDELLLFDLKSFCELMIKDFINAENVLLILHHANNLNCSKLMSQCFWFLLNNVEILLFDPSYHELLDDGLVKKTDNYIGWLLKYMKYDNPVKYWHEYQSHQSIIGQFLDSLEDFDAFFLYKDGSKPVFDLKKTAKKTLKSPNIKPRTNSIPATTPIVNLSAPSSRKSSISLSDSTTKVFINTPSTSRQSSVVLTNDIESSSAVEFVDVDGDGFQPVQPRRRKSSNSSARKVSFTSTGPSSISIAISKRNASVSSLNSPSVGAWADLSSSPLNPSISGSTPPTNKAHHWPEIGNSSLQSSNSKIVFNKTKLSQKERKKMMKAVDVEASPSLMIPTVKQTGWKRPSSSPAASSSSSSLLLAREEAKALQSPVAAPSLRGIMHEEEHNILVKKKQNSKSLQEIQQEQEFAIWWEEESRKVQNQMNQMNINNNSNNVKLKSNNKPRKFNKSRKLKPVNIKDS